MSGPLSRVVSASVLSNRAELTKEQKQEAKEALRRDRTTFRAEIDTINQASKSVDLLDDMVSKANKGSSGNYIEILAGDNNAAFPINKKLLRTARVQIRHLTELLAPMFDVSIKRKSTAHSMEDYSGQDGPSVLGAAMSNFLEDPNGAKFGGINPLAPVSDSNPPLISRLTGLQNSPKIATQNTLSRLMYLYLSYHPEAKVGGGVITMPQGSALQVAFNGTIPATYLSWYQKTNRSKTNADGVEVFGEENKSVPLRLAALGIVPVFGDDAPRGNGAVGPWSVAQALAMRPNVPATKVFDPTAFKTGGVAMILSATVSAIPKLRAEIALIDGAVRRGLVTPDMRPEIDARIAEIENQIAMLQPSNRAVRDVVVADARMVLNVAVQRKKDPALIQLDLQKDAEADNRKRNFVNFLNLQFKLAWEAARGQNTPLPPVGRWRKNLQGNYRLFLKQYGFPTEAIMLSDPQGIPRPIYQGGMPSPKDPSVTVSSFDILRGGYETPPKTK